DAGLYNLRHRLDVVGAGCFILCATSAHHVGPHRAVGDLRGDVDGARHRLERVEVRGKGLPTPDHALGHRCAGNVLDALHEPDQPLAIGLAHRREAHTAV